ncbi:MAG: PBSX family phage terminase large subunit [Bacteroidales bacterium]|nr:PBSX family phage terminase large subunit [Candidatus Scybalousia scybalohippi]
MKITKKISPAFEDFVFNWDYETYLELGGYGSGKSYHIAFKIILKLLEEKRKALVVRQVYDTIQESCYDLFCEILDEMGLLTSSPYEYRKDRNKVLALKSPLRFNFHNGSKIIFKGLDKPEKVKSINSVSIVWLEECSEINFGAYEELLGRIRTPDVSMHFILSCNPVGKENWVFTHFFRYLNEDGDEVVILDENKLYEKKCVIKNGVWYHHTLPTDNPWLPWQYLKRLDNMKTYDHYLYMVARWGRFGATGTRVLPQIVIPTNAKVFKKSIEELGPANQYFGFDFGFEESYNAVVSMAVDLRHGYLYIFDEIYVNHVTDDKMANIEEMTDLRDKINGLNESGYNKVIVADNEDPKAISYYRQCGYPIRACRNKFHGSRLSNTRKIKRFRKIFISPKCKNTIRELRDLTYKKDSKGNVIYDEFNIDPHTFSAIWYALDTVTVADLKDKNFNSKAG